MELAKNFQHKEAEENWYARWNEAGFFNSEPDGRPAYTIVIPPPNVTGVLHMGHALNNTVQDILIRRAKMQGFNTCWVPGTDHASIATEAKVVGMLREKGIDKANLSREEFLKYAWEWKEKYGGIILKQLEKLGCTLDWNRTNFTMDGHYYKAVMTVFNDLYKKGHIYRGVKMINWDPKAQTALSDEEVIHRQTNSKLYYVRYRIDSPEEEYITVATVRPETILGDTAVCVHPNDPRYAHLKGQFCFVPLVNRRVPIIFDDYIDLEFGTGALKVTPAHDINDYNLAIKHNLEVVDTLNPDGTMSAAAQLYVGMDRFDVRKKIIGALKDAGNFVKDQDYVNQVGFSERTDVVIEPRLSMQWWCRMDTMAKPALDAVLNNDIEFYPGKFKNLYRHWMENIKDWCISRQLSWGHRIPAWYDKEGTIYVAETADAAHAQYREAKPMLAAQHPELRQDEDVLDTWFSSWLWPLEVFNWDADATNKDLSYYYPTQTLVTAPEIIFFWVARMIMAGYEYTGKKPFSKVYFTGIVRDKQGRKMSKSLGNSPDLLQLIEDNGADAVRFSVMITSPAGNDLLYDDAQLEQGRNFYNKIWNAAKLVQGWSARTSDNLPKGTGFAEQWIVERIKEVSVQLDEMIAEFKLSEALKTVYSLIWNDFCSWYLEWVKPAQDQPIATATYNNTLDVFDRLLQLLHPFMPFVTEEVYHKLRERAEGDFLMVLPLAPPTAPITNILAAGLNLQELVTAVRDTRNKHQIKPKEKIRLYVDTATPDFYNKVRDILMKQVNCEELSFTAEPVPGAVSMVVKTDKLYFTHEGAKVDTSMQREQMTKELEYYRGFVESISKKLDNERFMKNARPDVVEMEQKKRNDGLSKIKALEEGLNSL